MGDSDRHVLRTSALLRRRPLRADDVVSGFGRCIAWPMATSFRPPSGHRPRLSASSFWVRAASSDRSWVEPAAGVVGLLESRRFGGHHPRHDRRQRRSGIRCRPGAPPCRTDAVPEPSRQVVAVVPRPRLATSSTRRSARWRREPGSAVIPLLQPRRLGDQRPLEQPRQGRRTVRGGPSPPPGALQPVVQRRTDVEGGRPADGRFRLGGAVGSVDRVGHVDIVPDPDTVRPAPRGQRPAEVTSARRRTHPSTSCWRNQVGRERSYCSGGTRSTADAQTHADRVVRSPLIHWICTARSVHATA